MLGEHTALSPEKTLSLITLSAVHQNVIMFVCRNESTTSVTIKKLMGIRTWVSRVFPVKKWKGIQSIEKHIRPLQFLKNSFKMKNVNIYKYKYISFEIYIYKWNIFNFRLKSFIIKKSWEEYESALLNPPIIFIVMTLVLYFQPHFKIIFMTRLVFASGLITSLLELWALPHILHLFIPLHLLSCLQVHK